MGHDGPLRRPFITSLAGHPHAEGACLFLTGPTQSSSSSRASSGPPGEPHGAETLTCANSQWGVILGQHSSGSGRATQPAAHPREDAIFIFGRGPCQGTAEDWSPRAPETDARPRSDSNRGAAHWAQPWSQTRILGIFVAPWSCRWGWRRFLFITRTPTSFQSPFGQANVVPILPSSRPGLGSW